MSHTIPFQFVGPVTITPEKVNILKDWYLTAGIMVDKATEPAYSAYYKGFADGVGGALSLLHDDVPAEVVEVAKKSGSLKKKLIIVGIGVGIYSLWNYDKIKAKAERLREQAQEDAKIKKIQENHKD